MKQLKHRANLLTVCVCYHLCLHCSSSANVTWSLMSPPGVFRSTIYLLCNITGDASSCHNSIRQWLGGRRYGPLCQEKGCGDDPKYGVKEETNFCSYTLMIHDFSLSDVECDYTCSYGVSNMRKSLKLNSEDFIYIPSEEEKISHIDIMTAEARYSLLIKKIYPSPKCFASYQGENLSKSMEINTTTIGILYSTEIHVIIPLHPCSGNLLIECILGNRKINVTEKKINGCKETSSDDKMPTVLILGYAFLGVVLLILLFILALKTFRRKKGKEKKIAADRKHQSTNSNYELKESEILIGIGQPTLSAKETASNDTGLRQKHTT